MKFYDMSARVLMTGLCVTAACGGSSSVDPGTGTKTDGTMQDRTSNSDGGASNVLRPSNLHADTCSTPASSDLDVPAGTVWTFDTDTGCDVVVSQGPGLKEICVRKFATITIGGAVSFSAGQSERAAALVATKAFAIEGGGSVDVSGSVQPYVAGADSRGKGEDGQDISGAGGAGGVVSAGAPGRNAAGGAQYGDPMSRQLVGGSVGGGVVGMHGSFLEGGRPGGAVQLVSCGELRIAGRIAATGGNGPVGEGGSGPIGGGGSGGGAGGTILLEAVRIAGSAGKLLARGGDGGEGASAYAHGQWASGGAGGRGGSGTNPPTAGGAVAIGQDPPYPGSGGGGGASGRILINVPEGTSPSLSGIEINPPAQIGTVGTPCN